ncbi:class I SAM-dependent methyltransferase [Desulforhopalus sp. 52FAK]
MNIKKIIETAQKPHVYTPGTALMWIDEYISTQLLEVHLSQNIELASRNETTIFSTVEWILGNVPGDRMNILDLGCGPGLYTEKLAEYGHLVTGMDFSSNSINYAKESAVSKNLDINYVQQDYLELEEENKYDLILLIFTDFGVLTPNQREILLRKVYRALKPGGTFVFDVLNDKSDVMATTSKDWELVEKGFWRNRPYLALTESFYYEKQNVTLNQHIITDEDGETEVYRFWIHTFSHIDIHEIVTSAGFGTVECFDSVIPDSEMCCSKSVTFCIATKK